MSVLEISAFYVRVLGDCKWESKEIYTHLLLPLGVRNMGSVTASYGGHSELKQSHSSSFPTSPSTSNLKRLDSSQKCQTMNYALGAGVSLSQASPAPSLSSQRWGEQQGNLFLFSSWSRDSCEVLWDEPSKPFYDIL